MPSVNDIFSAPPKIKAGDKSVSNVFSAPPRIVKPKQIVPPAYVPFGGVQMGRYGQKNIIGPINPNPIQPVVQKQYKPAPKWLSNISDTLQKGILGKINKAGEGVLSGLSEQTGLKQTIQGTERPEKAAAMAPIRIGRDMAQGVLRWVASWGAQSPQLIGKKPESIPINNPALQKILGTNEITPTFEQWKRNTDEYGPVVGTLLSGVNEVGNALTVAGGAEAANSFFNVIKGNKPTRLSTTKQTEKFDVKPNLESYKTNAAMQVEYDLSKLAGPETGKMYARFIKEIDTSNIKNIAQLEKAMLKQVPYEPARTSIRAWAKSAEQGRYNIIENQEPNLTKSVSKKSEGGSLNIPKQERIKATNDQIKVELNKPKVEEPIKVVRDTSQMTPEEMLREGIQPKIIRKPNDVLSEPPKTIPSEVAESRGAVIDIRPGETPPPIEPLLDVTQPRFAKPATATGDVTPRKINLGRYVLDEPQLVKLNERIASLKLNTKKVQTWEDVNTAAAELGTDPNTLIRGINKQTLNSTQVKALSDEINSVSQRLAQAEKKLSDPGLADIDRKAVESEVVQSEQLLNAALNKQIKGLSENARALNSAKQLANQTLDPAIWYGRAKRLLGNKEFTTEIRTTIDEIIKFGDRLALAKFVTSLKKPSFISKAITVWKTGLLSNPGTDIANLGGNIIMRTMENAKNVPAFIVDRFAGYLESIVKGTTPQFSKANPFSLKIIGEQLAGFFNSGPKRAYEYLKTGKDFEDAAMKWDANTNVTFDTVVLQKIVDARFKSLQAEDLLFREPALRGSIAEQAIVIARNRGLKGPKLVKTIDSLIKKPTPEMVKLAREDAKYSTFQQENNVASWLSQGIKRSKALEIGIETTAPFRRTIFNIFNTVIDYSPFGMPKTVFKTLADVYKGRGFNKKYFSEGLGRSITGSTILGTGWYLARKGQVIGSYPKDEKQRNALVARGIQPYSIKVPGKDTWVRLDRFQPFATLFFAGVDSATAWSQPGTSTVDRLSQISFGAIRTYGQSPYMQGFSRFTNAITNPENYGGSFVEQFVSSFVPNMVSSVARGSDPYQRDVNGLGDALKSKIPGLRQTLSKSIDVYGREVPGTKGIAGALFSPVVVKQESQEKNDQFIKKLGYGPSTPNASITVKKGLKTETIKLNGKEKENYLKELGKATSDAISILSNSPKFFDLPPEIQNKLFTDTIERYRSLVTKKYQMIYQNK